MRTPAKSRRLRGPAPVPSRRELLAPVARWRPENKARLLRGVQTGLITKDEVCAAHGISAEEFDRWWALWCDGLATNLRATVKVRQRA